jgi:hypothetical protein
MSQNRKPAVPVIRSVGQGPGVSTAPPTPAFYGLVDRSSGEIVNFNNGGTSHDPNPGLVFGAYAGDTMSLYDNGILLGTMPAKDGVNGWTLPTLADGPHNLSLFETNPAGETSSPLNVSFTVNTAPSAPVLLGLVDRSTGEIVNFAPGGTSHDATPAIVYAVTVAGNMTLYDNGVLIATTPAKQGTNGWDLPPLTEGLHNLKLIETSAAGADSPPLYVGFTVDTAPPAPVLWGLVDRSSGEIVNFPVGGTSHDPNPAIVFSAQADGVMVIYDNGVMLGMKPAEDGVNGWTLPTLADGVHNLTLVERNGRGATSKPLSVSFTVDTTPATPVLLGLVDRSSGDIENFPDGGTSHDANPGLVYGASAGNVMSLYDGGALIGTMIAKGGTNGWTLPTLANGLHTISLFAANAAGVASAPLTVSFTVDVAPASQGQLHAVTEQRSTVRPF